MENETVLAKLDGLKNLIEEKFRHNAKEHEVLREDLAGKAGKWTEKFAITIITTIIIGFVGALVGFVIGGGTILAASYVAQQIIKIF